MKGMKLKVTQNKCELNDLQNQWISGVDNTSAAENFT